MKKTLILACMIATAFVSCSKEDPEVVIPERVDIVLTKAEAEVLEAGTDFSFDLFREVASRNDYNNIFISPLSAHIATCMLANGAEGETYSQIVKTLGYEGFNINDVNSAYNTLVTGLRKVDTSTKLEIANALWVNDIFPVSKTFADGMAKNYDAYVKNLDFGSRDAVKTINKWCSDKTGKMIPDFLKELESDDVMLLMNALYFDGKWKEKFEKSQTVEDTFTTLDSKQVKKEFMRISKRFIYSETEDEKIRMCELPYGNGAFVMDIILPDQDLDFKSFIGKLTGEGWKNMFTYRGSHKIELALPKFKMEAEYNLKEALSAMGMELAYDSKKAELKKMCSNNDWQLWVDRTIQKSVIEVNEDGSKAAAVTAHVIKGTTSPGPESVIDFTCDHPFMFMIRETTSGAILFMGTYTK
ncbi:MAG: serpin family protein [Bacteroidales bacterium]|nr:serpin family protein [Bacteroidales bacterium]